MEVRGDGGMASPFPLPPSITVSPRACGTPASKSTCGLRQRSESASMNHHGSFYLKNEYFIKPHIDVKLPLHLKYRCLSLLRCTSIPHQHKVTFHPKVLLQLLINGIATPMPPGTNAIISCVIWIMTSECKPLHLIWRYHE